MLTSQLPPVPRDEAAQERADATRYPVGLLPPGYVQCEPGMHPDHGEAVVLPPGKLLPDWMVAAFVAQRPDPDEHGVFRLTLKPKVKR